MITKNKSEKMKQFKYLLIVPLLFGMLLVSSFDKNKIETIIPIEENFEVPTTGNNLIITKNKAIEAPSLIKKNTTKLEISHLQTSSKKEIIKNLDSIIPTKFIAFSEIENVPVFPGCEGTEEELRQCLQEKITKHVNSNFNTTLANSLSLTPGVKRIFVMFKIDKKGNIRDVQARAPHKVLNEEAIRVINILPKMTSGKMAGKNVGVKYSLPIAFNVEGDKKSDSNLENVKNQEVEFENIPFAVVDNTPIYPGCTGNESELRECLLKNINKFVNMNFNSELANDLNLKPGLKRAFVMFKIDENGDVVDVQARAPHKDLQEEAIRTVSSLPKMIPGKMEGKNVAVKYSLPIAFNVGDTKEKVDIASKLPEDPIYILDGKKINKEEMKKLDPDKIESINVLKGEAAIKKYGEKGENGVIEITLKE